MRVTFDRGVHLLLGFEAGSTYTIQPAWSLIMLYMCENLCSGSFEIKRQQGLI